MIADIHLGYGWAQRRRGELGPLADERARDKLFAVVAEMQPQRIVFLGDLVHAPKPSEPERALVEDVLSALARMAHLIAVRGNHDRAFAQDFNSLPVESVPVWQTDRVTAVHGDRFDFAVPEQHAVLLGHLHPCLPVHDAAGASHKIPVFLHNRHCVLLPAFSPFARGYDMRAGMPDPIASLFREEPIQAVAASGKRVLPLGSLADSVDRMLSGENGAPKQFQAQRRRRISG